MGVSICLKKVNLKFLKMGHARSRKGYFSKRSPLQALSSDLAEVELRRCEGADLQIGQERPHAFPDRRHSQGFPRSRSGEIRDGSQSSAHPEGERIGLRDPRRSLPHDQEGRLHQKASGEEQKGPRRQVSSYSDGVAYPSFGALLQDQARPATNLEIRIFYRFRSRCLNGGKSYAIRFSIQKRKYQEMLVVIRGACSFGFHFPAFLTMLSPFSLS